MKPTRWAAVAVLLTAGLGTPAAAVHSFDKAGPRQAQAATAAATNTVSLTGVAVPTKGVLVSPGTLMSTYGHLRSYDSTGKAVPLVHKYVYVETRPLSNWTAPYQAISTGVTTSTGYFYANWKAGADVDVRISFVSSDPAVPSEISYLGPVEPRPRPSWLDGVTRPTSATTLIRTDTQMSAFGHLRVLYSDGKVGPYAGQRVRVQIRPANEPTSGPDQDYFDNVGEAVTTSTGYFYANWKAGSNYSNSDVYVRLAFPGHQTIIFSVQKLGVIHVH